mmetsp:Transcript_19951/g.67558  ORF Transcript_19951/g.67558 Transcript_19951/m.67558 type:complete len:266 (+) Transcript_19951:137-934(+)
MALEDLALERRLPVLRLLPVLRRRQPVLPLLRLRCVVGLGVLRLLPVLRLLRLRPVHGHKAVGVGGHLDARLLLLPLLRAKGGLAAEADAGHAEAADADAKGDESEAAAADQDEDDDEGGRPGGLVALALLRVAAVRVGVDADIIRRRRAGVDVEVVSPRARRAERPEEVVLRALRRPARLDGVAARRRLAAGGDDDGGVVARRRAFDLAKRGRGHRADPRVALRRVGAPALRRRRTGVKGRVRQVGVAAVLERGRVRVQIDRRR